MNRKLFIDLSERLEGLVTRLPGSLQEPILRELRPVKEFFLLQRAPRIAMVSAGPTVWAPAINTLLSHEVFTERSATVVENGWFAARVPGCGYLQMAQIDDPSAPGQRAIIEESDLVLAVLRAGHAKPAAEASRLVPILAATLPADVRKTPRPAVVGLVLARENEAADDAATLLHQALRSNADVSPRLAATVILREAAEPRREGGAAFDESRVSLAKLIGRELPNEARLDAARLFDVTEEQEEIAQTLIKSMSAVSGVIGAQPIPLADFPILTTLQIGMVCGIIYISGEEPTLPLAGRFLTATGLNLGAALILREGARGLSKFFPGWGQAIGGGVAAAGTYAIGKAAMAHFIHGAGMHEVRGLFQKTQRRLIGRKS